MIIGVVHHGYISYNGGIDFIVAHVPAPTPFSNYVTCNNKLWDIKVNEELSILKYIISKEQVENTKWTKLN